MQNSKQLGMDVYNLKLICIMISFVYGLDFWHSWTKPACYLKINHVENDIFKSDNMKILKKWFCKHDYEKVGFREEEQSNIRFSMRLYKCRRCGKEIWVDGRKSSNNPMKERFHR